VSGDGSISVNEFKAYLSKVLLGYTITGADFKAAFKALDINRDGKVSEQEFLAIFK
jgi:Ca2+-binding EF-hand superfamily protein